MRGYRVVGAAVVALLLTGIAQAQTAAPATGGAGGCELHVWPASGLNSVYYGWLHGGIVNGATTGRDGYPQVPTDPMDVPSQIAMLTEAQPQIPLGLTDYRLVVHGEALSSRDIRASTTRLGGSDSPCYSELIIDDIFFQQGVFSGSDLKTSFRFREFGAAATPQRIFGTWVHTPLLRFAMGSNKSTSDGKSSAIEKGQDPAAAIEEMKAAYKQNVVKFAQALLKAPRKKR
jgi:hypothetical protein